MADADTPDTTTADLGISIEPAAEDVAAAEPAATEDTLRVERSPRPGPSLEEQDFLVRTYRSGIGYAGAFSVVIGGVALGTLTKVGLSEELTRSLQDGHARRTQALVRWGDDNGTKVIHLAETGVQLAETGVAVAKAVAGDAVATAVKTVKSL